MAVFSARALLSDRGSTHLPKRGTCSPGSNSSVKYVVQPVTRGRYFARRVRVTLQDSQWKSGHMLQGVPFGSTIIEFAQILPLQQYVRPLRKSIVRNKTRNSAKSALDTTWIPLSSTLSDFCSRCGMGDSTADALARSRAVGGGPPRSISSVNTLAPSILLLCSQ